VKQNTILVQTINFLLMMKALQLNLPRKPTKLLTGTRVEPETVPKITVTNVNPRQLAKVLTKPVKFLLKKTLITITVT